VLSGHDFYDFSAKYMDSERVRLSCPADIGADVRARVQDLAVAAFDVMGCEGLARVDVFLTDGGEVVVNEINTMPGFTPHSMYPRMWAASGVDYPALVDRLPSRLLDHGRVATSPSSPAVAAWGEPAIIWRCGVTPPGPTTQDCIAVNGIDWVVQPLDDGTGFVTYGRDPAVQVLVPDDYAPETFALTALAAAVGSVPQNEHRCT
jgi:hypothetical protein